MIGGSTGRPPGSGRRRLLGRLGLWSLLGLLGLWGSLRLLRLL